MLVLRVDAGHRKGMGHLFRALVLAPLLSDQAGECLFAVRGGESAAKVLEQRGLSCALYPEDKAETAVVRDVMERFGQPRAWVFDMLDTDPQAVAIARGGNGPVVCFDDLGGGLEHADLVLNPIAGCWARGRGAKGRGQVLSGPRYAPLGEAVLRGRRSRSFATGLRPRLAVALGGSDTYGYALAVADALAARAGLVGEVAFYCGPAFRHGEALASRVSKMGAGWTMHAAVPDLLGELAGYDVAISGGGITLFEVCAMGLPVLAVANEPHEAETIDYFAVCGAAKRLLLDAPDRTLDVLADAAALSAMSEAAMRLVDGRGAQRCAEAIGRLLETPV